jgi:hypothetical protein
LWPREANCKPTVEPVRPQPNITTFIRARVTIPVSEG